MKMVKLNKCEYKIGLVHKNGVMRFRLIVEAPEQSFVLYDETALDCLMHTSNVNVCSQSARLYVKGAMLYVKAQKYNCAQNKIYY